MKEKIIAIVPAAGIGKRFGEKRNKPFEMLGAKPLIVWALEALESVVDISEVIPVFKEADMEQSRELIEKYGLSKVKRIALGGKERQDSVYNGLNLIDTKPVAVLIHDGVRPLIEKGLIELAIKEFVKGIDGVIVGVPVKDTIKKVQSSKGQGKIFVQKTLDRKSLWAIQTPQVFLYSSLMKAYKKAMVERFYSTDDAAIIERYGGKVKVVKGSYENIKVTTPEDLEIAEMLLKKRLV